MSSVASPETWTRFTEDNIKRSVSERIQSDEYINIADNLLKETSSDIWNQFNTVNEAFEQRVHETNDAKEKIQHHLGAVSCIEKKEQTIFVFKQLLKYYHVYFFLTTSRIF